MAGRRPDAGREGPVEAIAGLDRLVHEPARLAILTALSACRSADFPYLARVSGLTYGNLSSHLTKLEASGLIAIDKSFKGRSPTTRVQITEAGRSSVDEHWRLLERLREESVRFVAKGFEPSA